MYYVKKRLEVAMAHRLTLNYESKCCGIHGHNAIIEIYCKSETLDENGMVIDFSHIKNTVYKMLDHKFVNEVFPLNPTAENLAKWICDSVPHCYKVSFQESEDNIAIYEK